MDRLELREFLEKVQELARKWREDTEKAVRETEALLDEMRDYLRSKGRVAITPEEAEQYDDAKKLLREAREELTFFDGVEKGVNMVAKQIRERLAMEELANAGRWVIRPTKPRRK